MKNLVKFRAAWWCVTFAALSSAALPGLGAVMANPAARSIDFWVSQLPGVAFSETVVTQLPQSIDVTVARATPSEYTRWGFAPASWPTPDPHTIVWHFVSQARATDALSHVIATPPLPAGLYDIRLQSRDRTVIQHLNVGTLGIMANRTFKNGVLMGFDLRTYRKRSDIRLTEYFESGPREFRAHRDGLIYFPYPWMGRVHVEPPVGTLVVSASDGSVAVEPFGWKLSASPQEYFKTDRQVYRPGDTVRYHAVARYGDTKATNVWLSSNASHRNAAYEWLQYKDRVAEGHALLSDAAATGYYDQGRMFVADTRRSRFEIEAGPLTPEVHVGEAAKFVISVLYANGIPAKGERVRYAWHAIQLPESFPLMMRLQDDLRYSEAVTDSNGDATVTLPVTSLKDVEIYAFDPDDGAAAASARAQVVSTQDAVTVYAPFADISPRCFPVAVGVTAPDVLAKPNQKVKLEIRPNAGWPTPLPTPALLANLKTSQGGFAMARWCARQIPNSSYLLSAGEVGSPQLSSAEVALTVQPDPTFNKGNSVLMVSADRRVAVSPQIPMTSTSTGDGDALVIYGSGYVYRAKTTTFNNGMAHFTITPRGDDDVKVSILLGSRFTGRAETTTVFVRPKKHLLHLRMASTKAIYTRPGSMDFTIHVRDWRGRVAASRLLVSITQGTAASIANALAHPDSVYHALYDPQPPNGDYVIQLDAPGAPHVSYLYPEKPSTSIPAPHRSARPAPMQTEVPQAKAPHFAPQTMFWRNDLTTDASGNATLRIPLQANVTPGIYVLHVIALTRDAKAGDAYAWVRVR